MDADDITDPTPTPAPVRLWTLTKVGRTATCDAQAHLLGVNSCPRWTARTGAPSWRAPTTQTNLWTQLFHSALNAKKAIAFVAPNKRPATGWKCTDAIVGH